MNGSPVTGIACKPRIPNENELISAIALLGRVKQKIETMRDKLPLVPAEARPVDRQLAAIYQDLLKLRVILGEY